MPRSLFFSCALKSTTMVMTSKAIEEGDSNIILLDRISVIIRPLCQDMVLHVIRWRLLWRITCANRKGLSTNVPGHPRKDSQCWELLKGRPPVLQWSVCGGASCDFLKLPFIGTSR